MSSARASGEGAGGSAASSASAACAVGSGSRLAASSTPPPTSRNGIFGSPGIRHRASTAKPPIRSDERWPRSWLSTSLPMSPLVVARVTMSPVATDISRAGIWETSPSPTLSRL